MRIVFSIALAAALVGAASARADIGVLRSDPAAAAPGERASVAIGCGGCPLEGLALPIALVPAGHTGEHPCRGTSCARASSEPPLGPPYIPVGVARPGHPPGVNRLEFDVPEAEPGRYAYVIWCGPCWPGRDGSLIGHPSARYPAANAPRPRDYRGYLTIERPARGSLESLIERLRDEILAGLSPS